MLEYDKKISLANPTLNINKASKEMIRYKNDFYDAKNLKDQKKALFNLLKELNLKLNLPSCGLKLKNEKRQFITKKENSFWLKALYICNTHGWATIKIWVVSETGRKLSKEIIFNLFLHEFVHHYEMKKLRIDVDHDSGFVSRMKHLKKIFNER